MVMLISRGAVLGHEHFIADRMPRDVANADVLIP